MSGNAGWPYSKGAGDATDDTLRVVIAGGGGGGGGGDGLATAANQQTEITALQAIQANTPSVQGALTDGSGTVTTGGTSQQVFAALATRRYLFIQNPDDADEPLLVNIDAPASAANSYRLVPGGALEFSGSFIPSGIVNVTAATTAHAFIAKQG